MNYDNPAARLLEILKKGKAVHGNQNCRETWRELLMANTDAEILSRLGLLMKLSSEAADRVRKSFPDESETVNYWSSQLASAFFAQNIQTNWQSFISHIDNHTINYLAAHSKLLSLTSNVKPMMDEDIKKVREKLDSVYQEILDADIDLDVKKFLLRYISKIIHHIDEYFLTGALPILEAAESAWGHAVPDKKYRTFLESEELGKKVLDALAAAANVVTVTIGLPQISAGIALLSGNA